MSNFTDIQRGIEVADQNLSTLDDQRSKSDEYMLRLTNPVSVTSGGCAEERRQDLNFSQARLRAPPLPQWDVLLAWIVLNAALWLVLGLLLSALFNLFEGPATRGPQQPLAVSDLIDQIENSQELEVAIARQEIEGPFRDGREFKTSAPEDPILIERLRANGARIEASPPG